MCRIPKVLLIAPAAKQAGLRRALSSLEYDIVAVVASAAEVETVTADAAVLWEPDAEAISALQQRGIKTAAIGVGNTEADLHLAAEDVTEFKTRIWELFAPR